MCLSSVAARDNGLLRELGSIGGPGPPRPVRGDQPVTFARPDAAIGLQEEQVGERPVWVLPNTSGLNAHYRLADFARLYARARKPAASLVE